MSLLQPFTGSERARVRTYAIDRDVLPLLVVGGLRILTPTDHTLAPEDARLVGIHWDEAAGRLLISLEHESFEATGEPMMRWPSSVRPKVERANYTYRTDERAVVLRDGEAT